MTATNAPKHKHEKAAGKPRGPAAIDFKVKDLQLADFGRKEIQLAEVEMPGLRRSATSSARSSRSRARASRARCT